MLHLNFGTKYPNPAGKQRTKLLQVLQNILSSFFSFFWHKPGIARLQKENKQNILSKEGNFGIFLGKPGFLKTNSCRLAIGNHA
jgi:hypothetical protein